MKRLLYMLAVGVIFSPLLVQPVSAALATLYLSPSSSTVSNGSTISIRVYENSGSEPVNGVQANLSYPSNLLDFVSITSSSAFGIVAESSGGGGSVRIGRGAQPAVTGNQLVATVRFRAKASSGTATISVASSSAVVSAKTNKNIRSGGGGSTLSLRAPAPAAEPAPKPPKDTKAPKIKEIEAKDVKINSAVITWTTSEPATSEVRYGLNDSYGLSAGSSKLVTAHKVTLSYPNIIPATKYHYAVRSVDPAGNAVTGDAQTFTSEGLSLLVTVVNQDNKKVEGAKVSIAGKSAKTNKDGQATLTGLPLGNHTGVVEHQNKKHVINAVLAAADISDKPKSVTLNIETSFNWGIVILPLTLLLLAAAALLAKHPAWRARAMSYIHRPKFLSRVPRTPSTPSDSGATSVPAETETVIKPTDKEP